MNLPRNPSGGLGPDSDGRGERGNIDFLPRASLDSGPTQDTVDLSNWWISRVNLMDGIEVFLGFVPGPKTFFYIFFCADTCKIIAVFV